MPFNGEKKTNKPVSDKLIEKMEIYLIHENAGDPDYLQKKRRRHYFRLSLHAAAEDDEMCKFPPS